MPKQNYQKYDLNKKKSKLTWERKASYSDNQTTQSQNK